MHFADLHIESSRGPLNLEAHTSANEGFSLAQVLRLSSRIPIWFAYPNLATPVAFFFFLILLAVNKTWRSAASVHQHISNALVYITSILIGLTDLAG